MTIIEFLLARIAEDEQAARLAGDVQAWRDVDMRDTYLTKDGACFLTVDLNNDAAGMYWNHAARHFPTRVLAECAAKRAIVELHQQWPVLVQGDPQYDRVDNAAPGAIALRMSQQIAWLTEQEYRRRFGSEPPTAPMLRALAAVYADHPDYDPAWAPGT